MSEHYCHLVKLNEQRSQGLFCDVTIVVEDVKFRAHKNILAACSGYFRNALTASETWSSSQVLELMDLKSEVFASILNFIYSSKVTSPGSEDTRGLVAAGKRLGIPFLEKLAEQERQDESSIGPVCKTTKKEAPKPEEIDMCPGINPFTPLVQTSGERRSPDVAQPPSSCPTTSCLNGNNETAHALSEHSYAVSPLKKRHRLTGIVGRTILPTPAEPQTDTPYTVTATLADGVTAEPAADSISIYGCEHCSEIFMNKALLTVHSEVHKKRFVSHLFCKFCRRKFIHLKRLRNHEQVCPKSVREPPKLEAPDIPVKEMDPHSEDMRRYNCRMCKRVYVTLSSLKRHENVHSWQRAYPCHYCNKVFALAEYRTKHEIWHTGERRYQCIFCLETFMTYYILKNHQKSFHGIDPSLTETYIAKPAC
uniref:Zinc finger and BTB domain containing 38 n=1 Tax=Scophthalmus maximus TaxID=52904 RepID=A0A8D3D0P5_SCOMX